jgi:hypothetical protein
MCDGNHNQSLSLLTIDYLIRIALHQIKSMPVIAPRKSLGIIGDRCERIAEFRVEPFRCILASCSVPTQRFGEIGFGRGGNAQLTHPGRPSVEPERELLARAMRSFALHHIGPNVAALRPSIPYSGWAILRVGPNPKEHGSTGFDPWAVSFERRPGHHRM